jgi:hypothetical protein
MEGNAKFIQNFDGETYLLENFEWKADKVARG